MIRKYISRSVLMLVFLDQLVLAGSMSVALWAKTRWLLTDRHLPVQIYIDLFLRLWPFLAATLALAGAYNLHTAVGSIRRILQRTLAGAAGMAGVWILGTFYLKMNDLFNYSRVVFTVFLVLSTLGLIATRLITIKALSAYRKRYGRFRRVLVFGGDVLGPKIVRNLQRQLFVPFRITGMTGEKEVAGIPRLSEENALKQIRQGEVDVVIVDLPPGRFRLLRGITQAAEREGVALQITPTIFRGIHLKPRVDQIGRIPVVELCGGELPMAGVAIKRLIDIVVSATALVILSPLFLVIAILIKMTSSGPVFYVQDRIGLNGWRFRIIKFRTMRQNSGNQTEPTTTAPNDQRVTRPGRILRQTSMDELPQLVNVLLGSMSLVGPRPEQPEFVKQLKTVIERYCHKHWVKPGITGWAQVNGLRGQCDLKRRIQHDIYYIEHWSLWLDFKIILLTFTRGHKNAY